MIFARASTKILARNFQTAAIMSSHRASPSAAIQQLQVLSSPPPTRGQVETPTPAPCTKFMAELDSRKTSYNKSCNQYYSYFQDIMMSPPSARQVRLFSTAIKVEDSQELNASTIKKIREEMAAVDSNEDRMIQPEEFRKLLRMHTTKFHEREIDLMTESFYAGTGGKGVAFDKFLEALEIAAANPEDPDAVAKKLGIGSCGAEYLLGSKTHAYTPEELDIDLTHKKPEGMINNLSFQAVKAVRFLFDTATGWRGEIKKNNVMNRVIYLETIAAVPGMVAGILRHFKSLRAMERDGGMLNMFLEEALNERMHLLTFVKMKNPGFFLRAAVLGGQVGFGTFYGLAYVISPKFCHTFVGYVEEEACSTYTKIIKAIEEAPEGSELGNWRTELAPEIGRSYWHLGENGTVLDLMYAIRADEAEHRDVNHYASEWKRGDLAPVGNPKKQVDLALKKYVKDLMSV